MMKRILSAAIAVSMFGGAAAIADENDFYRHDASRQFDRVYWGRGDHFSGLYFVVDDWR